MPQTRWSLNRKPVPGRVSLSHAPLPVRPSVSGAQQASQGNADVELYSPAVLARPVLTGR